MTLLRITVPSHEGILQPPAAVELEGSRDTFSAIDLDFLPRGILAAIGRGDKDHDPLSCRSVDERTD